MKYGWKVNFSSKNVIEFILIVASDIILMLLASMLNVLSVPEINIEL